MWPLSDLLYILFGLSKQRGHYFQHSYISDKLYTKGRNVQEGSDKCMRKTWKYVIYKSIKELHLTCMTFCIKHATAVFWF